MLFFVYGGNNAMETVKGFTVDNGAGSICDGHFARVHRALVNQGVMAAF